VIFKDEWPAAWSFRSSLAGTPTHEGFKLRYIFFLSTISHPLQGSWRSVIEAGRNAAEAVRLLRAAPASTRSHEAERLDIAIAVKCQALGSDYEAGLPEDATQAVRIVKDAVRCFIAKIVLPYKSPPLLGATQASLECQFKEVLCDKSSDPTKTITSKRSEIARVALEELGKASPATAGVCHGVLEGFRCKPGWSIACDDGVPELPNVLDSPRLAVVLEVPESQTAKDIQVLVGTNCDVRPAAKDAQVSLLWQCAPTAVEQAGCGEQKLPLRADLRISVVLLKLP